MSGKVLRFLTLIGCALIVWQSTAFAGVLDKRKPENQIESAGQVKQIIAKHFQSIKGYQSGDLISSSQVEELFGRFERLGWTVEAKSDILARVVKSGSFLDTTMNSAKGKKFFRQVNQSKNGADRLERMLALKNGRSSIRQLVYEIPNGADYVKALATSRHGKVVDRGVNRSSAAGKNFSKPTGKIYIEEALTEELVTLFEQRPKPKKSSKKRRKKQQPKRQKNAYSR